MISYIDQIIYFAEMGIALLLIMVGAVTINLIAIIYLIWYIRRKEKNGMEIYKVEK